MKFKAVLLTLSFMLILSANAFGWAYYDFGASAFDEHNNTSDVQFPDYGWVPSPDGTGDGGELYDIEGLNFAYDQDYIYVTMTNTFGWSAYSNEYGDNFDLGHIFFGFNGSYFDYALNPHDAYLYSVDTYAQITDKTGSYYNNVAIRNYIDGYQMTSGTSLGWANNQTSFFPGLEPNPMIPGNGDTYVFEYMFSRDMLGVELMDYGTINFSVTVECGNDLLRKDYNIIPEPGTLILLGMGLLGMGVRFRRKQ
jgi:PEP-CTERM motif